MTHLLETLRDDVLSRFRLAGTLLEVVPHERGHIHDTFVSTWRAPAGNVRFLHQRMNRVVFPDLDVLMRNVERVTSHLTRKAGAVGLSTLELIPTVEETSFVDVESGAWRTYRFIENTESFDRCLSSDQAFEAARAFGRFQRDLADLDAATLEETIPRFFSPTHRFEQLKDAIERDVESRVATAGPEIEFARDRADEIPRMESHVDAGRIPIRVVHGDTKLNNVLFDAATGRAVCVVDLDTCMPAWSLYDFGDLVRFTAAKCAEDEPDVELAGVDVALYRAIVEGYLESAAAFLTPLEVELMPFAARIVTLTIGLRFLADHLAGDVYFKTSRENQNLERARVQFRMVADMEARERELAVDSLKS